MPYHGLDHKAKIQFVAPPNFPSLIHKACVETDTVSNTRYIQEAMCARLARDLGLDEQELIDSLPPSRGMAAALFGGDRRAIRRHAPRPGR
jgi:hypothetical protein